MVPLRFLILRFLIDVKPLIMIWIPLRNPSCSNQNNPGRFRPSGSPSFVCVGRDDIWFNLRMTAHLFEIDMIDEVEVTWYPKLSEVIYMELNLPGHCHHPSTNERRAL